MALGGGPSGGAGKPAWEYVLHGRDSDFGLFWAANDPKRPGLRTLGTDPQAETFLRGTKSPQASAAELRRMLRATWMRAVGAARPEAKQRLFALVFGPGDLKEKDGEELLTLVAQLIAADKLRVERIVVPTAGRAKKPTPPPERVAPAMATAPRTELTWIGIELLRETGDPVGGANYEITLPDGSVRKGKLDGKGKATERGVDPGTCKVKFPTLDDDVDAAG